tara:strand:- start:981 stop:1358 length:378 start_codon:yes stop_codon:yes gene_type:complete
MAKDNSHTKTEHVSRTYNRLPNRSGPKTRLVQMDTPIQTEHEYPTPDEDKNDTEQVSQVRAHRTPVARKTYEGLQQDNVQLLNLVKKLRKNNASSNNIDEVIIYIVSGFIVIFILENLTSIIRRF